MDRGAGELSSSAEELRAVAHHHETALEPFTRQRCGTIDARIHDPFRRLAFAKAKPAGGDVVEVDDEGRALDLRVPSVQAPHEPLVGLGVVLAVGLAVAGATNIETHCPSPCSGVATQKPKTSAPRARVTALLQWKRS